MSRDNNKVFDGRTRETSATREAGRVERTPVHIQNKEQAYSFIDAGYRYRIIKDVFGEVDKYKRGGWEVVYGDVLNSYQGQIKQTQESTVSTMTVNQDPNAKFHKGVLVRIPIELWQEDQAAQHAAADQRLIDIDETREIYNNHRRATRQNVK